MNNTEALGSLFDRKVGPAFSRWYQAVTPKTIWSCQAGVTSLPNRIEIRLLIAPSGDDSKLVKDGRSGATVELGKEDKGRIKTLMKGLRQALEGESFDLMSPRTPYIDQDGSVVEGIQIIDIYQRPE